MDYLVGSLELLIVWGLLFYWRNDLRREMIYLSSLLALTALLDPLFTPHYWSPNSIFKISLGSWYCNLESLIYSFATGGIAFSIYKVIANKRIEKESRYKKARLLEPMLANTVSLIIFLIISYKAFQSWMLAFILTLYVGTAIIVFFRSDLLKPALLSGVSCLCIHTGVLFFLNSILFPGFVSRFWNAKTILGVFIMGIPLEELLFSLAFGMTISVLYEYLLGYELKENHLQLEPTARPYKP